jgi:hypothetical protein
VITHHGECRPSGAHAFRDFQNGKLLRPSIDKVADKNHPAFGMAEYTGRILIIKSPQKTQKSIGMAVDIADYIEFV